MFKNTIHTDRSSKPPQDNVPRTKALRDEILELAKEYVRQQKLIGPLPLGDLQRHCETIIEAGGINPGYLDFLAVLVNNEIWREAVSASAVSVFTAYIRFT